MLDRALEASLSETVLKAGQPETVARRLTAWLRAMSKGSLSREDHTGFLDAVRHEVDLEDEHAD